MLSGLGLSLAILYVTLSIPLDTRIGFLTQNTLIPLNSGALALGLAPTLFAALLVLWKREPALAVLESIVRLAAPLLLAFALPGLF
ncbi:MAG TPA: hypothetical protein VGF76_07620, partial [Polyangiaceae bacterium]